MFKIFKDDDEQFLEEMLIQTLVNSQIENLKSYLEPLKFPLSNFRNRPEMQCLGFYLTEADIKFKKGHVQTNFFYKEIKDADT